MNDNKNIGTSTQKSPDTGTPPKVRAEIVERLNNIESSLKNIRESINVLNENIRSLYTLPGSTVDPTPSKSGISESTLVPLETRSKELKRVSVIQPLQSAARHMSSRFT